VKLKIKRIGNRQFFVMNGEVWVMAGDGRKRSSVFVCNLDKLPLWLAVVLFGAH